MKDRSYTKYIIIYLPIFFRYTLLDKGRVDTSKKIKDKLWDKINS